MSRLIGDEMKDGSDWINRWGGRGREGGSKRKERVNIIRVDN